MEAKTNMIYRFLGKTGLKVSVISFGNWLNSNQPGDLERNKQLVKRAWQLGINFFDTAELYGEGQAEKQFGECFKELNVPRHELVVSTKLFWGPTRATNPNDIGLSRKHVIEGLKCSLKRLQLDYVDIVFCHRFDQEVPVEETCRAYDWCIRNGLTHYWGTSEWSAQNIFEAMMICKQYNLILPVADQCQYNMFVRDKMEMDYSRLFQHYGYGSTVWSPLLGGMLTGKYNDGIPPQDSRVENFKENPLIMRKFQEYFGEANKPKYTAMLQGLAEIAKELGCSQAALAMAWVIKYPNTSTAITGSTKVSQLEDIVTSIDVLDKLTPEVLARIEALLNTRPQTEFNFRGSANHPPRR